MYLSCPVTITAIGINDASEDDTEERFFKIMKKHAIDVSTTSNWDKCLYLKILLHTLYIKYPEYVLINHRHMNKLIMYPKENNFAEFVEYTDWEYYLKTTLAKTSRMIFRRKDGIEINTNLRLRMVLNNGLGALIGKSEKNKCSIPCLKIQQDKVGTLISKLVNTITDVIPTTHGLDLLADVCSQIETSTTYVGSFKPSSLDLLADVCSQMVPLTEQSL